MRVPLPSVLWAAVLLGSLSACGDTRAPTGAAPAAAAASSRWALPASPLGTPIAVLGARAGAPRDAVVVEGRVRDVTKGLAAFTLTDLSMKYCGEASSEDGCKEPWDYCCYQPEELASRSLSVQVREQGEVAAGALPELRLLDVVVVAGRLVKEKDDVVLEATGWYRRERPTLPPSIRFPE